MAAGLIGGVIAVGRRDKAGALLKDSGNFVETLKEARAAAAKKVAA